MHVGQAIILGAWRGLMAEGGPRASAPPTVVRMADDQTLENLTGQRAPPWTWPRDELLADVPAQGVSACMIGAIADAPATEPRAWIEARSAAGRAGSTSGMSDSDQPREISEREEEPPVRRPDGDIVGGKTVGTEDTEMGAGEERDIARGDGGMGAGRGADVDDPGNP